MYKKEDILTKQAMEKYSKIEKEENFKFNEVTEAIKQKAGEMLIPVNTKYKEVEAKQFLIPIKDFEKEQQLALDDIDRMLDITDKIVSDVIDPAWKQWEKATETAFRNLFADPKNRRKEWR